MNENYSWIKNILAAEMMAPSADWMYICRKEMQKMREEWLMEDKLTSTLENNRLKKEEEKQKKDEKRRLDEQMALAESMKNIKRSVCELEDSRKRMEKENAKERKKMEEYIKMLKADMEKEREKMREFKERIQRERELEKEDLKEYVVMIQGERQKEREDIKEHIKRALEEERKLFLEETKNIQQEWMKQKKWMAKCIEEEKAEKLEMKRTMWWMKTERHQEKHQLMVYQQRDELRLEEMEQLKKEVDEKLGAQREKLKNEFKDREMRMQLWERKQERVRHDEQKGWMAVKLELQKEKSNRAKSEQKTNQLARKMYLQNVEWEDKFLNIIRDFGREKKVTENKPGFFGCLKK